MIGPAFFSRGELTKPVGQKRWHRTISAFGWFCGVLTSFVFWLLAGAALVVVAVCVLAGIALIGAVKLIADGSIAVIERFQKWRGGT